MDTVKFNNALKAVLSSHGEDLERGLRDMFMASIPRKDRRFEAAECHCCRYARLSDYDDNHSRFDDAFKRLVAWLGIEEMDPVLEEIMKGRVPDTMIRRLAIRYIYRNPDVDEALLALPPVLEWVTYFRAR